MNLKVYLLTLVVLLAYDLPMILKFNNKMYNNLFLNINNNNKIKLNNSTYASIIAAYLLLSFGLYYFVIRNSTDFNQSLVEAFMFGIIIYGVYNTTNYSTIVKYSQKVTITDTIWGGILLFLVTATVNKIKHRIN